jgi:leucyl aminopeptidase
LVREADVVTVKVAKKKPANAGWVGTLVTAQGAVRSGVDKKVLGRLGFKGEPGQTAVVPARDGTVRVLVGVGKEGDLGADELRKAAAAFAKSAADQRSAVLELGKALAGIDESDAVQALTEGLVLAGYRFDRHRSKPKSGLGSVTLVGTGSADEADGLRRGRVIADAVCWARDLVNEPGGTLTPTVFADRISERASDAGVEVEVLDRAAIERERMGGVLAVNKGSAQQPRFVKLTYSPEGAVANLAFVGKGITFDSGGLSLKQPEAMMGMKGDMGGAAAVTAATCAVAALGMPVAITTYTPLTDNMTGGDAQRPGDVFTARNGKTVEVLNTDAEGRLILADALSVASESKPDLIVDLATLTGACMIALGPDIAGLMSTDESLVDEIESAARVAGEQVWQLPLPKRYRKQLDSTVADMKNIGTRYGGALTAGLFLKEFVAGGVPWAHVDIAGPAFSEDGSDPQNPKGGTGFGVRTLVALAATRANGS